MATKRTKKVLVSNIDRDACETAFSSYADADAKQQQITSKIDAAITKIRDKYQGELNRLGDVKTEAFEVMQVWAQENRDDLFSKKKSIEMLHGIIGFRTGTPKLKTLKGFTWASVTNLLSEFLPEYVRTVVEPAKNKLLEDREKEEVVKSLRKCGIDVVQDESFYVEPKKEEVE